MIYPRDLTLPLDHRTPSFPGDPGVRVTQIRSLERGDPYRLSALSLGSHAGTHLDAPSHFLAGGRTVESVELSRINGTAQLVVVPAGIREIGRRQLEGLPPSAERVLVRSENSARWSRGEPFDPSFAALTADAAELLVERGVRLVGVDGLSIESDPTGRFPVHHRLLGADCWILEGLNLDEVDAGPHELRCLPLRLTGADGAPCRAALWS